MFANLKGGLARKLILLFWFFSCGCNQAGNRPLIPLINPAMKKIDILNFITDFRKSPNAIKTHTQILSHLNVNEESTLLALLNELQQTKVLKETELNGEKAYQVVTR